MRRPEGLHPFYVEADGTETPLFVPPSFLEAARREFPALWIEPTPLLPLQRGQQSPDRS